MCIIVVKNKGVELPSKTTLKNCFTNNPDGCGYMYSDGEYVHIRKGFMSFTDFEKDYDKMCSKLDLKNTTVVYHFRITTQGGVRRELTHPYPLSSNMKNLKKLYVRSNIGVAHNGIIDLTSSYAYHDTKIDHNDTMEFITDYLSLIIKNDNFYEDKKTIQLIERLCGSKLAILDKTGHCTMIGDKYHQWKHDKKTDLYFSNDSYKEKTYKYNGFGKSYNVSTANSYYNSRYYDEDYDWYADRYGLEKETTTSEKDKSYDICIEYNGKTYWIDEEFIQIDYEDKIANITYYDAIALNDENEEVEVLLLKDNSLANAEYEIFDVYE